ncbi:hypothetical protein [Pseudomonas sp. 2(2015)]|uniref:hypothetical protein n=1 Tax=Pseudomonas sp. 2(2015) TaxID=1619950 RepID=UPI0012E00281|nr:hypothetical protein [Pseudomonas sp. 2(2015)]
MQDPSLPKNSEPAVNGVVINQLMRQALEAVTLSGKNLPDELNELIAEGFSE